MLAALALGSNLPSHFGGPAANLREAVHLLEDLGHVLQVSSFYETDPVGYLDQPRFTNAAALLETHLAPHDLLHRLLAIEQAMGRIRSADVPPKGPRVLDLDLLLYQGSQGHDVVLDDPDLILPHPAMHLRSFVLAPLVEIAPELRHGRLHKTVRQLWQELSADAPAPCVLRRP